MLRLSVEEAVKCLVDPTKIFRMHPRKYNLECMTAGNTYTGFMIYSVLQVTTQ